MRNGVRVFGHPLHAMLSHVPLALLGTSLIWDAIAVTRAEPIWWAISFWNIALGLVAAMVVATVGSLDYATIEESSPPHKTAGTHMWLMIGATAMYAISLALRNGPSPPEGLPRVLVIVFEFAGLAGLGIGGWCGAHLVFHYGVGRTESE